jgi:hypothetical protein
VNQTLARVVLAAAPALLAAGCSSAPASGPAIVTLFGPGARLETWRVSVIDGEHIHSGMTVDPCTTPALTDLLEKVALPGKPEKEEQVRELSRGMGSMMEAMMADSYGRAHGGRNRRVVVLRHFVPGSEGPDEAVVVDLPVLKSGETERLFKAGEFRAVLERPPTRTEAVLERGWVRVTSLAPDRLEFELFLVFKPARPEAGYETAQVVTRVEWPPSR